MPIAVPGDTTPPHRPPIYMRFGCPLHPPSPFIFLHASLGLASLPGPARFICSFLAKPIALPFICASLGRPSRPVARHSLDAGPTGNALFRDASAAPPAQPNLRVVDDLATVRGAVVEVLSDADEAIAALDPRGGGQPGPPCATASGQVIEVASGRTGFR